MAVNTGVLGFLTRTRGRGGFDITDWITYGYLLLGVLLMFLPVVWVGLSSLKSESALLEYPPTFLPYGEQMIEVEGYDEPLPLFMATLPDGTVKEMAQVRRTGIIARMIDPENPDEIVTMHIRDREPVRELAPAWENYSEVLFGGTPGSQLANFDFPRYLWNSVFITGVATLITLLFNSMAAFALAKYEFKGRVTVFIVIISTLMIPPTIVLVPTFLVVSQLGMLNSPWGVIWPAVATPTGVFLLRQYMLTIPDDLLDAARMDNASEWKIYWRIVLPLCAPALAVLAIFSIIWRWNEFLWPLIVLNDNDNYTLQLALNAFQGELVTQWHYLLAMTVLVLLPVTIIFAFLQRYITAGIASVGVK